jgi:hypothetical protein
MVDITNPLCSFYIEGEEHDPDTYAVVMSMLGETGNNAEVTLTNSAQVRTLTDMLSMATDQLEYAEDNGLRALVDVVGHADDDEEITVEDILRAKDD